MVFTSQPLFFAALSVPRNTIGLPSLQPSRLVSSILTLIRLVLLPNCPPRPLLLYPIPSTHSLTIPFFPTTTLICLLLVLIQHIRSRSVAFCLNPQRTISSSRYRTFSLYDVLDTSNPLDTSLISLPSYIYCIIHRAYSHEDPYPLSIYAAFAFPIYSLLLFLHILSSWERFNFQPNYPNYRALPRDTNISTPSYLAFPFQCTLPISRV